MTFDLSSLLQTGTQTTMAMPLRIIEVLTDTSTYTKGGVISEEEATDAVLDMYSFLIARGRRWRIVIPFDIYP